MIWGLSGRKSTSRSRLAKIFLWSQKHLPLSLGSRLVLGCCFSSLFLKIEFVGGESVWLLLYTLTHICHCKSGQGWYWRSLQCFLFYICTASHAIHAPSIKQKRERVSALFEVNTCSLHEFIWSFRVIARLTSSRTWCIFLSCSVTFFSFHLNVFRSIFWL